MFRQQIREHCNAPGEKGGSIPNLVGLYSICTAIASTLEAERPDEVIRRAAELRRAIDEFSSA
jgi:hypothetical protein